MCTKTVFFYIYHMANIAIFASGNGTNAENIIRYFADNNIIKIAAVFSNKEKAPVLEKAKNLQVPAFYFKREDFSSGYPILEILHELHIDGICLAGFLCMVSPILLKAFPKRIINIHPSLLPKFGGKGMYGLNVHRKVIENAEKESGITIHYIDELYDQGEIICQATCPVLPTDTPEELASRVHSLEYKYYPLVIERIFSPQEKV